MNLGLKIYISEKYTYFALFARLLSILTTEIEAITTLAANDSSIFSHGIFAYSKYLANTINQDLALLFNVNEEQKKTLSIIRIMYRNHIPYGMIRY